MDGRTVRRTLLELVLWAAVLGIVIALGLVLASCSHGGSDRPPPEISGAVAATETPPAPTPVLTPEATSPPIPSQTAVPPVVTPTVPPDPPGWLKDEYRQREEERGEEAEAALRREYGPECSDVRYEAQGFVNLAEDLPASQRGPVFAVLLENMDEMSEIEQQALTLALGKAGSDAWEEWTASCIEVMRWRGFGGLPWDDPAGRRDVRDRLGLDCDSPRALANCD